MIVLLALGAGLQLGCNIVDLLPSKRDAATTGGNEGGAATSSTSADSPAAPTMAAPVPPLAGLSALPSFAELVKRSKPAIVLVRALHAGLEPDGTHKQGLGTGFVYDSKGFLLTNNHVIAGAVELRIKLADGRELPATVVGADPPTDLAVLRVRETGLPVLPLGDSKALEVGDWVVAIGNPFGLENTVSAGILSAKGRTRDDVRDLDKDRTAYFNFLQTDASINPGNSGGPLLNVGGQVVGINAAVRTNANNIGFAIPMEMVLQLIPKLLKDGRVHRSAIGIVVESLSTDDKSRLKLEHGAKVQRVLPEQPGAKAGLVTGDVIVAFDGQTVEGSHELRWLASLAGVGRTVDVKLLRKGKERTVKLTLGALDD